VGIIVNITSNGAWTLRLKTQDQVELEQTKRKHVAAINERQCETKKMV
jgi:hypothetical protein